MAVVALEPAAWDEWTLQDVGLFDATLLAIGVGGAYISSSRSTDADSLDSSGICNNSDKLHAVAEAEERVRRSVEVSPCNGPSIEALDALDAADAAAAEVTAAVASRDPNELQPFSALRTRLGGGPRMAMPATDATATFFDTFVANADASSAFTYQYLEINSWLWALGGVTFLVDPVLEGPLDFGLPAGVYSASKRVVPPSGLVPRLPAVDAILITQGLDDHAHVRTLKALASDTRFDATPILAPLSARVALEAAGMATRDVSYLRPGEARKVRGVDVTAVPGARVGPPWQARENGYVLRPEDGAAPSVYYEPHVESGYSPARLARDVGPVDVLVTPIEGQTLPAFELVHDSRAAASLAAALNPRWVVPMANGAIDATGATSLLVRTTGSITQFREEIAQRGLRAKVADVQPGVVGVVE